MKILLISIIAICFTVSCISQEKQSKNGEIIGYEKYDNKTVTSVDYMNRDAIPKILKTYYYDSLEEKDFYKPQIVVSIADSTRTIQLKSRTAKEGYLYINKYSNAFITNYKDVVFIVGQDTINSKNRVMKLVEMKRSEVISIDTLQENNLNLIRIN